MAEPRLNPDLMGCPLYRKLMPRKIDLLLPEIGFPVFLIAADFAAIWGIESRTITDNLDIAQNIGLYVVLFAFTLMICLLDTHECHQAKTAYKKRTERLSRIPEAAFWELDAEVSMAELQYGSFYFLQSYLYAPKERLLIRYEDIATWHFANAFTLISGDLKDAFLDIVEKDGFKTQIIIRQRGKLLPEREQVKVKLNASIMKAKYPGGSPYQK